jgi:hypothetical protein
LAELAVLGDEHHLAHFLGKLDHDDLGPSATGPTRFRACQKGAPGDRVAEDEELSAFRA